MSNEAAHLGIALSSHIQLRRLSPGDLDLFQAYRQDPDVARYQGWTQMTDAEATSFLTHVNNAPLLTPGDWLQIAIADVVGTLLGDIGLCLDTDLSVCEIGVTLARHAQGQGVASTAMKAAIAMVFDLSSAQSIQGIADHRNDASIRLLKRIGMTRTGQIETEEDGEVLRENVFTITRAEFETST